MDSGNGMVMVDYGTHCVFVISPVSDLMCIIYNSLLSVMGIM